MATDMPKGQLEDLDTPYYVYILECRDGSYYVGITNNMDRRLNAHNEGVASRYTRSRRPVADRTSKGSAHTGRRGDARRSRPRC